MDVCTDLTWSTVAATLTLTAVLLLGLVMWSLLGDR